MKDLNRFLLATLLAISLILGFGCSGTTDDYGVGGNDDQSDQAPDPAQEDVGVTADKLVGPVGYDNGTKSACTGTTGSGVAIVCVDTTLGIAAGPGTAASPYKTISQAIAAAKAGDTIQVAQGTYAENPAIGSFNSFSSKRLNILGGFQSGQSFSVRNQGTYRTLLDNNLATVGLGLYVGASANNMVVDGLAIRRGKGLGTAWNNGYGHGGGVYVQWTGTGVLTLSHLEVYDSQTNSIAANSQQGGGLWVTTTANGVTTGRVRVEDSHFYNNKAGKGAGVSSQGNVDFFRNRIESNLAQNDHGGGFYINPPAGGSAFEDNLVKSNTIGVLAGYGWGGGGSFIGSGTSGGVVVTLKRNVFTNNSAPSIGSGVFFDEAITASMTNDLLYKNLCSTNGAAIYVDGAGSTGPGSALTMTNVTVANHACSGTAIHRERASTVVMKNSILHGNTNDQGSDGSGSISATYSKTALTGTGNITSDPQFVDATNNDFHLKSTAGHFTTGGWVTDATTSPAIDAGDPASTFTSEPSPNGSRINMGFEGNTAEASKSGTLDYEACPGQPYTITLGASPTVISGNLSTSANDVTACSTSTNDRVYKLNLSATGGILTVSTDAGTLALRTTCSSGSGELCGASATIEATASTYYVVVEGSTTFNLTVSYVASTCGDGFVASTEECEPPTAFCNASCQSEAPDPAAESCPGKSYSVLSGSSVISTDVTTINYADDLVASCVTQTGGQDFVFNLTPAITGTLTAKVGFESNGTLVCDNDTCDPRCWDAVLSARSTCTSSASELACSSSTFGGETISIPVTAATPVAIIVDGVNAGWYAKGPFELRLNLVP